MNFTTKHFDELNTRELYEILKLRSKIFVVEQNCIYQDMDGKDYESLHVFSRSDQRINAYLRLFYRDKSAGIVQIGRVVTAEHGQGFGGPLLREGVRIAKERMQARSIYIEAQCYAIGYYAKAGFKVCSKEFLEDGIPHVCMTLDFSDGKCLSPEEE